MIPCGISATNDGCFRAEIIESDEDECVVRDLCTHATADRGVRIAKLYEQD